MFFKKTFVALSITATVSYFISNLSGSFTLMFSLYFGLEKLTVPKALGMIFAFGGVVLVCIYIYICMYDDCFVMIM
jgi:drug/metabolite transporter (DMT)-like permease